MAFIYVYSPSDFVGGLPDEQGAAAEGSGTFELTLAPGAKPTLVEVKDNDGVLDEVDYDQTIASGIDMDGTSYSSGTTIHSAYDLINSSSGHQVTSIHFGGDGYEQGAVHGLVSTELLEAGKTYTFNRERTSHRKDNEYSDFVACFAGETLIDTVEGEVAVQDLQVGDRIRAFDGGDQPVRLVLTRRLAAEELREFPNLRPIRITAGAMGQGLPTRDLLVSPQHKMLVSGPMCVRVFGENEALISARKLTALPGVYVDTEVAEICYVHLVFDQHEIVFAEGAPSESFFLGAQAIEGLSDESRTELLQLFPNAQKVQTDIKCVRLAPKGREQEDYVTKLRENAQQPLKSLAD